MDDAQLIFDGALSNHVKMINEFKGNTRMPFSRRPTSRLPIESQTLTI